MSKFIDKLNQVSQAVTQPMGFGAAAAAQSKPKMLLVAGLAKSNGVADYVAGADAGLLHLAEAGARAKAFKEVLQARPDIPWGVEIAGGEEITRMVNAGCDFVVFPADSAALAMLQSEGVGKILAVEASLGDGLLRAVDKLPVDAVLISYGHPEGQVLTWHHLMQLQRYADLLTKPLLASIPASVVVSELQALWEVGVNGVVVEVGAGQPAGRLVELRQAIDSLAPPPQRKRGKLGALVPFVGGKAAAAADEGEEEEE